ncbi:class I SAM-dependent methyltransferase [Candidatus Woesearchaeota archaeon]|nr:class I SAM-dependent methyltransferase [Candidatus Woesearchaeota archaeon]
MDDYLSLNKQAYDTAAVEFEKKNSTRTINTEKIVAEFCSFLLSDHQKTSILELGPGNGQVAKSLLEHGFDVSAIELSPAMAAVALNTAPRLKMIVDEFLSHDFGSKQYSAIIGIAFIHLFPSVEIPTLLKKIYSLLIPQGVIYLSTTIHHHPEGYLALKNNFNGKYLRFRKRFTEDEFRQSVMQAGFSIQKISFVTDHEEKDKNWMFIIAMKN